MDTFGRDLLRYGEIISIDDYVTDGKYNTVRTIKYNDSIYKHYMVNGEIVNIVKIV